MNRFFSALGISLWIALLSPMVLGASLKTLDVAALPGDRVELKLSFDGPPPSPRGYTTEQPARIALDLPGVTNQLSSKRRDLGGGNARSATVVEAGDRTRLIIGLTQLAPYDTRIEGNNLFVVVGKGAAPKSTRPEELHHPGPAPGGCQRCACEGQCAGGQGDPWGGLPARDPGRRQRGDRPV